MIINRTNLDNLFRAFKITFQNAFSGYEASWNKLATEVPSTTAANDYAWLGQFPGLREWIGDRIIKSLAAEGYTIKNKKFESTVAIPRDALDDDQQGIYSPMMAEMGQAAARHPDQLVYGLIKRGFETLCYDGQFFFDTDHPVLVDGEETSVSNMQAGAGPAWFLADTSRSIKPVIFQKRRDYAFTALTDPKDSDHVFMRDEYVYGVDGRCNVGFGFWQMMFASKAELNKANFDALYDAMCALKNEEGETLGLKPKMLIVPTSLRATADALIKTQRLANGADNPLYNIVEVMVAPWLD